MKTISTMRKSSSAPTTGATKMKLIALGVVSATIFFCFIVSPRMYGNSEGNVDETTTRTDAAKPVNAAAITSSKTNAGLHTAKIITCPRCRLNSLPKVKDFVHEHAKHFAPALKIDFILGKDPVLYLYENEKEVEKIPLDVSLNIFFESV